MPRSSLQYGNPIRVLAAIAAGVALVGLHAAAAPSTGAGPAEWPQYRADAVRSGFVEDSFDTALALQWVHQPRQAPDRAWLGEDTRMSFDSGCHPIVVSGGLVFMGSSAECSIVALDAANGAEQWRYVTDAPVRFAPAVWEDQVFAVSDDGVLYVLNAADGRLLRHIYPAPREDMVLGNGRMISRWPGRGGPVIRDGILYFGAGIWPSEGVFLRALDAATGEEIWRDDESGYLEWDQPHGGARAESGIAAQGYLVATEQHLLVPTGRGVPAAFDRAQGGLKYFHLQQYGKPTGGATIVAAGDYFFNGGHLFAETTGISAGRVLDRDLVVAMPEKAVYSDGRRLEAIGWAEQATVDRRGDTVMAREFFPLPLASGGRDHSIEGVIDGALELGGAAAHAALAAPWAGQPATFAAWVRVPRDIPDNQRVGIIAGNHPDSGSVNWEIHTQGRPRVYWNGGEVDWTVPVDLRTGEWVHYAFVRDAENGQFHFYQDGVLAATHGAVGDDVPLETAAYVGADKRRSGTPRFTGAIDDMRVYDRPLSADQLAALASRHALESHAEGLVFHLPLDERPARPGSQLADASVSANHGRLLAASRLEAPHDVHGMIAVGHTLVLGGSGVVSALDLAADAPEHAVSWQGKVEGEAAVMAWSAGRLYVSTDTGAIYCFGPESPPAPRVAAPEIDAQPWDDNGAFARAAQEILDLGGVREGYALDLGSGEGRLAYELAMRTELHIIAVEADPLAVAAARESLIAAGLYGTRVTVHQGDPAQTVYPNYFADLVVSARSLSDGVAAVNQDEMMRMLRPWGGVAVIGAPRAMRRFERGPLPGAGDWTHQYCDPAGTLTSVDEHVRRPLGMLWFSDYEHLRMPDRHGRGPAPLFANGRLFVLGKHGLYALNAYNGRLLWEYPITDILKPYDQEHILGAAVTGSPYCHGLASVFVRHEHYALRLDEATGALQTRYTMPEQAGAETGSWGFIATEDGVLFGSVANDEHITGWAWARESDMANMPGESHALFAIDADTGESLWAYEAADSIRHNAIAIGAGRVFVIDRPIAQDDLLARQARREDSPQRLVLDGEPVGHPYGELLALDARTGDIVWRANEEVFGTLLALSVEHDVLVMTYQRNHAYFLPSEVGGRMAAYRASSGQRLWSVEAAQQSRIMLNGDTIYAQAGAWNLLTGEQLPFTFSRSYGCGTLASSRHMLLFRSATLGYRDLHTDRTENYGGIRPGCWINAIPAGGLVLMPDATHGCTCSYLNKAYVALQPMG